MQWPVGPSQQARKNPDVIPYPAGSGGKYGDPRDGGRIHRGYDFAAPAGTPIYAIAPGRVYFVASGMDDGSAYYPSGWASGGRQVWLQHDGFMSRYLHLESPDYAGLRAGGVKPIYFGGAGVQVAEGQYLGTVGGTNFAGPAYGPHLHLEVVPGNPERANTGIDPIPFIQQAMRTERSITMAEAYVKAPNGTVIHFLPNKKTNFASQADYDDWRAAVNALRNGVSGQPSTDLMAPPELSKVVGISWDRYNKLCAHFGVPTS